MLQIFRYETESFDRSAEILVRMCSKFCAAFSKFITELSKNNLCLIRHEASWGMLMQMNGVKSLKLIWEGSSLFNLCQSLTADTFLSSQAHILLLRPGPRHQLTDRWSYDASPSSTLHLPTFRTSSAASFSFPLFSFSPLASAGNATHVLKSQFSWR